MQKIELQDIIEACEEAESEYLKLYRPLLGYEDQVDFNVGVDDGLEEMLNLIEGRVGLEFPADFLQIYLISNGGKYFDVTLYPLTSDKMDENGLYAKNCLDGVREACGIPENMLIIGETSDDQLILIGVDEEDYYYYCTWDKKEKAIEIEYTYLVELLMYEIDYHTGAFSVDEEE